MVGWHHQLDEHELEQALGVSDGEGTLACYSPQGRKELEMTETTWHPYIYESIALYTLK